MDPDPLTLRELVLMAEGRDGAEWERTSLLAMLIANANRDPKKHGPFKPSDFNPYSLAVRRRAARADRLPGGFGMLRTVFVNERSKT